MTGEWPENFEKLLRTHLPLLGDDPLPGSTVLAELGLDSMSTIGLLLDLEESFEVRFPDDALSPETFATASSLWAVLSRLRGEVAG
ncbi:phosphopantetheine-binding protein [Actinosynnema sp. CS-041913]|uniref:phosphopantetheine-binding protein n=1 Tax=Actinosynnema sp. CS-041913 TaxID=3239917 RepID=UPI003D92511A